MTYEEAKMQIQAIPEKIWDQLSAPDREAMEMAFSALQALDEIYAFIMKSEASETTEGVLEIFDAFQAQETLQPTCNELAKDTNVPCKDTISRREAIDALNEQIEYCNKALGSFDISLKDEYAVKVERASLEVYKEQLENLPSAQPEQAVKDCRNCKHGNYNDHWETHFCYNPNECTEWNLWEPITQPENTDCEYCHDDSDGYVKPIEKNCHAFIRFGMDGWELNLDAKGWHGSAKIMYCPMCGRRLERG